MAPALLLDAALPTTHGPPPRLDPRLRLRLRLLDALLALRALGELLLALLDRGLHVERGRECRRRWCGRWRGCLGDRKRLPELVAVGRAVVGTVLGAEEK